LARESPKRDSRAVSLRDLTSLHSRFSPEPQLTASPRVVDLCSFRARNARPSDPVVYLCAAPKGRVARPQMAALGHISAVGCRPVATSAGPAASGRRGLRCPSTTAKLLV
jgi:hypothetical protein